MAKNKEEEEKKERNLEYKERWEMEREDQVGTCLSKIERLEINIKDKNEAITGLMSDN